MKIIVKPNAPKNAIIKKENNVLHVAIAAPPEKNKANKELLKFLSRHFKKRVRLVRGAASRVKFVEFV
jgi:uncharacterized protein (TIGR00251 family)